MKRAWGVIAMLMVAAIGTAAASAQSSSSDDASAGPLSNPITVLRQASEALPGVGDAGDLTDPGPSQRMQSQGLHASISILLLLTVLTIAPSLLVLCTSFTRIVVVLALLRQAIGTQSLPPSQVIIGLAMFMTFLVMAPTFEQINRDAITPLSNNQISEMEAWERAKAPIKQFMARQIKYAGNEGDVIMILNYRGVDTSDPGSMRITDQDMLTIIPAFVLSELKVAFLMGFRLYLPFLIIDMVVSSVLISMGMLMLPPVLISLPFKLLLFVLVDGWRLVAGNLLNSFDVAVSSGAAQLLPVAGVMT